jgi:hypothetical protein
MNVYAELKIVLTEHFCNEELFFMKTNNVCVISVFRRGVNEIFALLEYSAMLIGG